MKNKIIHHLDDDFNVLLIEKRYIVNGWIEAIYFKQANGRKKVFRNDRKFFKSKKSMKSNNARFISRTRPIVESCYNKHSIKPSITFRTQHSEKFKQIEKNSAIQQILNSALLRAFD